MQNLTEDNNNLLSEDTFISLKSYLIRATYLVPTQSKFEMLFKILCKKFQFLSSLMSTGFLMVGNSTCLFKSFPCARFLSHFALVFNWSVRKELRMDLSVEHFDVCLLRFCLCMNDFLQYEQLNGLRPVCFLS